MIIRCPECSTGFRLSNERVRGEPIKVRCTNCEHVFEAGLIDGEPLLYDSSGDQLPDEQQVAELEDDSGASGEAGSSEDESSPEGEQEEIEPTDSASGESADGEPSDGESEGPDDDVDSSASGETTLSSSSASGESSYDPFPHAGEEAQPTEGGAISGDGEPSSNATGDEPNVDTQPAQELVTSDEETEAISDTAELDEDETSESTDRSEGAVSVHPEHSGESAKLEGEETSVDDSEESAKETKSAADAGERGEPAAESSDSETGTAPGEDTSADAEPSSPSRPGSTDDPGDTADRSESPGLGGDLPQDDDSIRAQQQERASAARPSAASGPDAAESETSADGTGGSQPRPAGPPTDRGAPGSHPPPNSQGPPGAETGVPESAPESSESTSDSTSAPDETPSSTEGVDFGSTNSGFAEPASRPGAGGDLALDEVDRVDSQRYGSGGLQTAANIALVVLLAAAAFVLFAAFQNNWMFDFQKVGEMTRVAFTNAEYEPRDELIREVPKPVEPPAPENPIEFRNVYVRAVTLDEASSSGDSKPRVLTMKGEAENVSDGEQLGVEVRGIVYDESGKVVTQATAPLGSDVAPSEIASAGSVNELSELATDEPVKLPSDESRSFTIVFDSVPGPVEEGANVEYRVEVADKYSSGESK